MGLPTGKKVAAAVTPKGGGGPPKGGVGKRVAAARTPNGVLGTKATITSWFTPLGESGARPGRGVYQGR
jgi:hypothetical protein